MTRPYIKPPEWYDCVWRSGPPPSVGWWPASKRGDPTVLRWWDGSNWSLPVPDRTHSREAASYARQAEPSPVDFEVVWTDRWWEVEQQTAEIERLRGIIRAAGLCVKCGEPIHPNIACGEAK